MMDWIDDLPESTKRNVMKSELERVLRRMADEIRELKSRVRALEERNK